MRGIATKDAGGDVFGIENGGSGGAFVVVCEHASNFIPAAYANLGLSGAALDSHIAWDPGALGVARRLSVLVASPLVWARQSRLVIDCNRSPDAFDLIVKESDGIAVPGNDIDAAERRRRLTQIHEEFHSAVGETIAARRDAGLATALVSIHSFTPSLTGKVRPWQIGVIFGKDRRLADRVLEGLARDATLIVGVNQPYSPADRVFYTHERHAEPRGLACVMIEIRNDIITTDGEQRAMAARLAGLIAPAPAAWSQTAASPVVQGSPSGT